MTGKKRRGILFLILLFGSLALRIYRLNQGLWYDEIITLTMFVHKPWLSIIGSLPLPNNHILYSLLAKISVILFGESEWAIRLPSLIIGGLTPPIAYLVLRKRVGEAAAALTGLFLSLSCWMVWFSQDARGYSGQILFSLLSQVWFLDWRDQRKKSLLILYLISSALAVYFHLYSAFLIAAQILFGFFQWAKDRKQNQPVIFILPVLALFLSSLLYLPGGLDLIGYLSKEGHDLGGRWLDVNLLRDLAGFFSGARPLPLAIILCALAGFGIYRLLKKWPEIAWLYFLSASLLVTATLMLRIFVYARFFSILIPFFYLGLAIGVEEIFSGLAKSRVKSLARICLAGLICVALSLSLLRYYRLGKQGLKPAAEYLESNYPLSPVISLGLARNEFRYYCAYARPVYGQVPLNPDQVAGTVVVASHPWSWAPYNQKMLDRFCKLEKLWPSAGYRENEVYLYNCLSKGSRGGSE